MKRGEEKNARGEETRAKLLEAGLKLYAMQGYSAVTTRAIADEAGVSSSAIGFHFRGKEGLYQAVIANIIHVFATKCNALIETLDGDDEAYADEVRLSCLVNKAVYDFVMATAENPRNALMSMLLHREIVDPSSFFERVYEEVGRPFLQGMATILTRAVGHSEFVANVQACCILSNLVGLATNKVLWERRLGVDIYAQENIQPIVGVIASGVCGIIRSRITLC